MKNAFREALKVTASGAATVLLSTVASCAFAIVIETGAHRLQGIGDWVHPRQHQQLAIEQNNSSKPNLIEKGKDEQKYGQHLEAFSLKENEGSVRKDDVRLAEDKSQSKFQNYQEKLEEKAQLLNADRSSKILLTTAMTGWTLEANCIISHSLHTTYSCKIKKNTFNVQTCTEWTVFSKRIHLQLYYFMYDRTASCIK